MKRRAISLLAILAMLCTMVVFAMPTTVAAAETYPRYKDHVSAMANGHDGKNWSISSKEDWAAMRDVADVATEDYFEGVTFHLTNDIEFGVDEANRQQPMGINTNGAAFAGTIDGHGYGFNNIYVFNSERQTYGDATSGGTAVIHTGLFLRLGNCTFRDFGLNSGLIRQDSSNSSGTISSFGTVMTGKVPTFERVWSSVYISSNSSARINGLAGTISSNAITVNVNGFVFDGVLAKGYKSTHKNQDSYAVLYTGDHNNPGTFRNIITDCMAYNANIVAGSTINTYTIATGDAGAQFALFRFSAESAFDAATMENVYGVKREEDGIDAGYSIGAVLNSSAKSTSLLTDMSAAEAAYTINTNSTENPVYYKLNEKGQVRPIPEGKSEGKIIKIAVTGDADRSVFVNSGSTVDLKTALGYKSELTFEKVAGECTINGTSITVGTGDVTVKMTNSCVNHDLDYTRGDKKHTAVCSICNHQVTEACKLTNCTTNELDWNAYTHNGACACGNAFSEVCDYVYTKTESGYKYVCSCGRTADASAPMVVGDAKGNGGVDLTDAIALLKKVVKDSAEINERNADVDGDNDCTVQDVRKIILYFMGVQKTVDEFEALEQRVNESNFYNEENIRFGNLKMDGSEGTNLRYIRTNYISVSKGNKIVFGPVRKAQAVLGHFYDADGNAIELINVNNERLENEYTFKAEVQGKDVEVTNFGESAVVGALKTKVVDGLEMVSITAPEGAAYVRLQANAKEEEHFYIRINNEFSLADYHCHTNGDVNTLTNEENGQLFLTIGDSLCSAARDDQDSTVPKKGWEGRINRDLGAETVDSSQGGSALSTVRYDNTGNDNSDLDTEGSSSSYNPRQCIVNQITLHRGSGQEFEYILLEGGGNDASQDAKIGYWEDDDPNSGVKLFNPTSYDPADFAPEDTFMGGLERAIYSIIKTYGDTVAIGFMLPYPMPNDSRFTDMGNYFMYVEEVCAKWDIPYLDLYYNYLKNFDTDTYTTNASHTGPDHIHADGTGYDIMQKYIGPFVENEMRPANQEIYLEIQQYEDIEQNLGK